MPEQVTVAVLPDCDIHKHALGKPGVPAAIDGRTRHDSVGRGGWANMCPACWSMQGIGKLGTGYGQRLVVAE